MIVEQLLDDDVEVYEGRDDVETYVGYGVGAPCG